MEVALVDEAPLTGHRLHRFIGCEDRPRRSCGDRLRSRVFGNQKTEGLLKVRALHLRGESEDGPGPS